MHPGIVAARWPGKMAVVVGDDDRLTYAELDRQSDELARAWRARGLGRGDVVALLLPNASRFFTVAWAAQRSGMYYVALPMQATAEEIAYVLDDARPRAFVVDGGSTGRALAALDLRRGPDAPPFAYATPEDPSGDGCFASLDAAIESGPFAAYEAVEGSDMLYTSGTTGRPKGVKPPLTQAPLGNDPRRTERARTLYAFDESSVFLLPAPVYHAAPLRFGMTALRLGSTLVLMRKFSPHAALAALGEHGVTHSQWVPTMFSRLLALPERERAAFASASHRVAIHSGGPCSIDVKQRMIDWWGPILHEYYSGSESVGFTHADSAEWLAHPGTVGRPFGCTLHIVDDDGRECAPGTVGNVFFESAHRLAYHNDEEKTRAALDARGWATMGDIGYVDGDGYLYLTDRRAFTVVSGGVNVYPREVEIALESHPDVIEAAAFGVPDVDLGERVHAVVAVSAARRNDPALAADVLRHARDRVAAYKLPKVVDVCDELPHLPSGKLDKRSVRANALERLLAK